MAVTRKKVDPEPKAVKKSEDRVVKRPARGFHRFRNGILNVTPKGGEKELVKKNQNSLLLQLPAELRHKIWKYVLGYKLLNMGLRTKKSHIAPSVVAPMTERKHGTGLLRTCRQIYSESASLPYSTNVFEFESYSSIKSQLKTFKPYQRESITHIQLNLAQLYSLGLYLHVRPLEALAKQSRFNLAFLPTLEQVHALLNNHPTAFLQLDVQKATLENQLKVLLADDREVKISIETIESRDDYLKSWRYLEHTEQP